MSMTLEEAILHAEEVATKQEILMGRYDAASGYARSRNESIRTKPAKECEKCAAEHKQLAEWLRELQERRKAPEIITCGECEHFRQEPDGEMWCGVSKGHGIDKDFFCGDAERRTDENNNLHV